MSNKELKTYHFETPDQWGSCLFAQVDRGRLKADGTVKPYASFDSEPRRYKTNGSRLPVVTRSGEVLWLDDEGLVHRLSPCLDIPTKGKSPRALSCASRIIATSAGLWALGQGKPGRIELFEADSFTRLASVQLPDGRAIDIASGHGGSVFVLVEENELWKASSFGRSGRTGRSIRFGGLKDAIAFTFLSDSQRFVILTGGLQPKLHWYTVKEDSDEGVATRLIVRPVAGLLPCFEPSVLGSDSKERVFLAGQTDASSGRGDYVLTFDSDGNVVGNLSIDSADGPINGLLGNRSSLLATGKSGLLRFLPSDVVQDAAAPAFCMLITPMLFSPDREDSRRWLRAEITASLPVGSTLEIAYASTDSDEDKQRIAAIAGDTGSPEVQRMDRLLGEEGLWKGTTVFRGSASEPPKVFSTKLFDERDRYIWVKISMTAAAAEENLPKLSKLKVLYPGRTLMENLPAVYQKEEAKHDSFLRTLVGVLETTTHGIDERIGSLGSLVDPRKAPEPWLDFVARLVGLPWDDALGVEQKRSLIQRADLINKSRGTRVALEAFLDVLFPGQPKRFRLTDPTADLGFATVGGLDCGGSTLPAILGGHARWNTELGRNSILGRMSLKCDERADDGLSGLAGKIRVDVAATAPERKSYEPWLLGLITELVPLTARVELRWVTDRVLRSDRLDGAMVLAPAPVTYLGTDAIADLAHLPDDVIRLTPEDPVIGRRIR